MLNNESGCITYGKMVKQISKFTASEMRIIFGEGLGNILSMV